MRPYSKNYDNDEDLPKSRKRAKTKRYVMEARHPFPIPAFPWMGQWTAIDSYATLEAAKQGLEDRVAKEKRRGLSLLPASEFRIVEKEKA